MKDLIIKSIPYIINSILPDNAVKEVLEQISLGKNLQNIILISIGKVAYKMAKVAKNNLKNRIKSGIVITKYDHSEGPIEGIEIYEAAHPISDENTIKASKKVLELTNNLTKNDIVLFLLSGGGSALFEIPANGLLLKLIQDINLKLLKSSASIVEINTVRKHLSKVKGGRFAQYVSPAKIISLVLSDVIGDNLKIIASATAYPDSTTSEDAIMILKKYGIKINEKILSILRNETPKNLDNVENYIIGNLTRVCDSAKRFFKDAGYNTMILTTSICCEAKEAGRFFSSIAKEIILNNRPLSKPAAIISGGETVVNVKGKGKSGRNQELALSFAIEIEGLEKITLLSFGTDGTDDQQMQLVQ